MKKPSPELLEALLSLRDSLNAAEFGESTALVKAFAHRNGCANQTVWRWLSTHVGYTSTRKKRADAGTTKLPEETLMFIASSKKISVRNTGKSTKPTAVAMNIADANGMNVNVSSSRINALLRNKRLDAKSQASARNHGQMRSLHPNHVHQIDPSLCLIYYMGGKQYAMTAEQFNKNKPLAMEKVKLKVWRYVRYDHASGCLDVRYFEAAGENQTSLFEFLMWTWGKQANRLSHGVPKRLLWDKGSANTSASIKRLLDALGVEHEAHASHHAWVKGGVEKGNDIVETHFESRLRDEPVNSIAELNAAVEKWVRDYNANAIKFVDCRIRRESGERFVRDALWQHIQTSELIEMPERKVCAWFLHGQVVERTIRDNRISFAHPQGTGSKVYDLSQWAAEYAQGEKVKVSPLLMGECSVRIEVARFGKEPLIVQVAPVSNFDAYGRDMNATIIGEAYATAPHTAAQAAAKDIAAATYGVSTTDEAEKLKTKNVRPFQHLNGGKGAVSHSHLGKADLPIRMIQPAQALDTSDVTAARGLTAETVKLTHTQAAIQLRGILGRNLEAAEYGWLQQHYAAGVNEGLLSEIAAHFNGETEAKATGTHTLKVVK